MATVSLVITFLCPVVWGALWLLCPTEPVATPYFDIDGKEWVVFRWPSFRDGGGGDCSGMGGDGGGSCGGDGGGGCGGGH